MKKSQLYFSILVIIIIIIITSVFTPSEEEARESEFKKFLDLEFTGCIIKKEIDKKQHSYPIVEVKSFKYSSIIRMNFVFELNHIYDSLFLGDTILKNKGQEYFWKKNNNTEHKIGPLKFIK